MKVFLSHIFFHKKLVEVTLLDFLFEVGHEVHVYCSSVSISFRIFRRGIASCKNVLFEGKTQDKYVWCGHMISLKAKTDIFGA